MQSIVRAAFFIFTKLMLLLYIYFKSQELTFKLWHTTYLRALFASFASAFLFSVSPLRLCFALFDLRRRDERDVVLHLAPSLLLCLDVPDVIVARRILLSMTNGE